MFGANRPTIDAVFGQCTSPAGRTRPVRVEFFVLDTLTDTDAVMETLADPDTFWN